MHPKLHIQFVVLPKGLCANLSFAFLKSKVYNDTFSTQYQNSQFKKEKKKKN